MDKRVIDPSETVHKSKGDHVAHQLLQRIIASDVKQGESFATEAELLAEYKVSRPTLRESLRILEHQGVLELRPGPGGGIILRRPSIATLAHNLSVFLCLHDVPFVTVLHAREVIEPSLAAEAAKNGTRADFDELQASIDRMKAIDGDQQSFLKENRVFHDIVARASGNRVLEVFWSTMSILASGEHHGVSYSVGNQQHVIEAHERILTACRQRDSAEAAIAMREHVSELETLVRRRFKHLVGKPTSVVAKPGRSIR